MIFERLASFPRVKIAHVPTVIEEMPNLAKALGGPKLFVKRDDCTGVAFGGNKARQLEYLFGEAVKQGADTVLITGAIQSNYARMAAAVARRLGMFCHIQLEERVPDVDELYRKSGNVLLDRLLGAELHSYPEGEDEEGADLALESIADDLRKKGAKPYVIHLGPGHPPLGALGYIEAAKEFLEQSEEMGLKIDDIILASGSGLTQGGLLFGLRALGSSVRLTGNCHRRDAVRQKERVTHVLKGIAKLLDISCPAAEEDIFLFDGAVGPGYGRMNDATREAILLAAQNEALFCDPVYSGKAMAGLIALIRQGRFSRETNVLFWHTGGQPAIFAYADKIFPNQ
ncbi:MAG: D-cysteine desulfhydrase family protein [Candidatus Aminicenantes bacterium]|jgi:D-cysteine desulfhydrase/L-cysteate sulfo-lyase